MDERFKLVHEEGYREIELYEAESLEELAEHIGEKGGLL